MVKEEEAADKVDMAAQVDMAGNPPLVSGDQQKSRSTRPRTPQLIY